MKLNFVVLRQAILYCVRTTSDELLRSEHMNNTSQHRTFAFVGSYAEPSSSGVYVCSYDTTTGALTLTDSVSDLKNPTYLDINESSLRLYALAEGINADGQRYGEAHAY